jgi:thiol-disulfide isomerase/thioredoxin
VAARAQDEVASSSDAAPSTTAPAAAPVSPVPAARSDGGSSGSNTPLAGGAVALGVLAFAASRLLAGGPSLAALEQASVPLDVALANGRPTVLEFYATWCVACRARTAALTAGCPAVVLLQWFVRGCVELRTVCMPAAACGAVRSREEHMACAWPGGWSPLHRRCFELSWPPHHMQVRGVPRAGAH